jgi:hypothetical protein
MEDGCMVKRKWEHVQKNLHGNPLASMVVGVLIPYLVILCLFGMLCNMEYHNFSFVSYKGFQVR